MFTFDVKDPDGKVVVRLDEIESGFEAVYPDKGTHAEDMDHSKVFPYPIYNDCVYQMGQLAIILKAYSESEYERFLEAYEGENR